MKRKLMVSAIILLFTYILCIGYLAHNKNDLIQTVIEYNVSGDFENTVNYILREDEVYRQSISISKGQLNKLILYFEKGDMNATGNLDIKILNGNKKLVSEWQPVISDFEDSLFNAVFFFNNGEFSNEDICYIEISINGNISEDVSLIVLSDSKQIYCEKEEVYNDYSRLIEQSYVCSGICLVEAILLFLYYLRKKIFFSLVKWLYWIKRNRGILVLLFITIITIVVGGIYKCLLDLILVAVLFLSSTIYGEWILKRFEIVDTLICCGVGLCIIGVGICYSLSLGIASKELYIVILVLPLLIGYKKGFKILTSLKQNIINSPVYWAILGGGFQFYIMLASRPISSSDALKKHLPISIYASVLGKWYDNIIENIVCFSESTLLSYSYSTMLVSFGCYKGLTLFNVFLFFIIIAMLYRFSKSIYDKVDKWLLLTAIICIPYIMLQLITSYTVDVLPILIVFTFILLIDELEYKKVIVRLPVLTFLVGCAVYTKLTILSVFVVLCFLVIVLLGFYLVDCQKNGQVIIGLKNFLKVIPFSLLLFFIPFIFSFGKNWWMTGNPFSITAYNNFFNSPYFNTDNFERPFENNAIGATLRCFLQIVFETSKTVETIDGSMGYIWLLIIIIPVIAIFYKNKKLFVWLTAALVMLQIAGKIVGNLRYIIAVLFIILALIVIGISMVFQRIKNKFLLHTFKILIFAFVFIPNVYFLVRHVSWKGELTPKTNTTICSNVEVLNYIPEDSRVFSFNDDLKGEFKGFYYSLNWYNDYVYQKIKDNSIEFNDFIVGFDYAIWKKTVKPEDEKIEKWYFEALSTGILLEKYQTENYILYEVDKTKLVTTVYPQETTFSNNTIEYYINDTFSKFRVEFNTEDVYANDDTLLDCEQRIIVEIGYSDKNHKLEKYDRKEIIIYPWIKNIDTGWIVPEKNCENIRIRIFLPEGYEMNQQFCKVFSMGKTTVLDTLIQQYYDRIELK